MRLGLGSVSALLVAGACLPASTSFVFAQARAAAGPIVAVSMELPENPAPQGALAEVQAPSGSDRNGQATPGQGSSSSQSQASEPDAAQSRRQKADEQIKEEEKQRVVGILPSFNVSYRADAVSMTAAQKMRLAFRSAVDPVSFAAALLVAGYHEANDDDSGFGWGAAGYGKRAGAAYLDSFDGTMIGNGILPALLHQDPRYFRLGHGTATHRLLYAAATTVICKHDNTGKWEPNYSNILGNIASGGISNLYYPSNESGIGQTFSNGLVVTAEGAFGGIFQEFWPDISRKILHKDPTHGLDDQARAADRAR